MTEAELILQKALVGSGRLDSSQWNQIQAGFRNRAFFSSRIAEVNILAAMRDKVAEYARGESDLSKIRMKIREDLQTLKYDPKGDKGTIHDLFSQARLDVIIKTNVAQARGYMQYAEGMSPGAFAAFPAQEFTRIAHRRNQRQDWPQRWAKAGGKTYGGRMIALKDDPVWERLSVFGNPFPPFDWGSGMGVLDVDRKTAIQLGLVSDEDLRGKTAALREKPLPDFNRDMQATVPNLRSDSLCGKILKREFGDQVVIENNVVHWQDNLIRDVLSGRINKARLGRTTPEALKKMTGKLPQEDVDAFKSMNPSFNRTTFQQHAAKHYGKNEKRLKTNIPLEDADYDLMPAVWHNPDTIYPGDDHGAIFEMQTFDGNYLQLAVNATKGFSSYYKTKIPLGAAPGNSSFIP